MKKTLTLISACLFVLYLSTGTFAQGRGGGHGQGRGRAPEVNHGRDHDTDRQSRETHEGHEGHKEANFEQRIEQNPALKSKVESMLPAGTNLKTAAAGFRNQGQFIAALHVSRNLGIPFNQLKAKMTGSNPVSLGQAVHALKPNMSEKDADKEAAKAEKEAKVTRKTKPIS